MLTISQALQGSRPWHGLFQRISIFEISASLSSVTICEYAYLSVYLISLWHPLANLEGHGIQLRFAYSCKSGWLPDLFWVVWRGWWVLPLLDLFLRFGKSSHLTVICPWGGFTKDSSLTQKVNIFHRRSVKVISVHNCAVGQPCINGLGNVLCS